ncbi:MAG: hypothetical protein KJ737_19010 [Proteobacteria bacterium]|nr:hypothetical protein [Pseudomonadota bacterium]
MKLKTCVNPNGHFKYGIHTPSFKIKNLREPDCLMPLGTFEDGTPHRNDINFPPSDVEAAQADPIYEIPNAFPFKGTTYITKSWADEKALDPTVIRLPEPAPFSFADTLDTFSKQANIPSEKIKGLIEQLPEPLLITIAATSTDPSDLMNLAHICCEFITDPKSGRPQGLVYKKTDRGRIRAVIKNHVVFETLANNPYLPDDYKNVMVLRPGVQGESEIVGDYKNNNGHAHIFEYLRRNSYIPWGHYAANMAHDSIRYSIRDLTSDDMVGLRHLYYQRTFVRLANLLDLPVPEARKTISPDNLEALRVSIIQALQHAKNTPALPFTASLWGWNFGFDFAPTRYRLHASHQQIHQQFALIPDKMTGQISGQDKTRSDDTFTPYGCGDMVQEFISSYRTETGQSFFDDYIRAIRTNTRMDGKPSKENSLIVHEDENVMVFVPKAQTSQWELQIMTLKPVGNILEADKKTRESLDQAILILMKILTSLGARMITCIEYPKRFDIRDTSQHLLYAFLPRLPESPGAFSEAQLRWINGHYPEDFAIACRTRIAR